MNMVVYVPIFMRCEPTFLFSSGGDLFGVNFACKPGYFGEGHVMKIIERDYVGSCSSFRIL